MASGEGDETYQQQGPWGPLTAPEEAVSEAVINHRRGPCGRGDHSRWRHVNLYVSSLFVLAPQTHCAACSVDSVLFVYLYILPLLHFSLAVAVVWVVQQGGVQAQISPVWTIEPVAVNSSLSKV